MKLLERESGVWERCPCEECGCSQKRSSWSKANKSRHTHTFSDWNKLHRLHRDAYCTYTYTSPYVSTHAHSIHLFSIFRINCYGFHVAMRRLKREWMKREKISERTRDWERECENPTKLLPSKWVFVCH